MIDDEEIVFDVPEILLLELESQSRAEEFAERNLRFFGVEPVV